MRRLPSVAALIERHFEMVRQQAGLAVDMTLLEPFADDLVMVSELKENHAKSPLGRSHGALSRETGVSLGDAYQRYVDDPTHAWTPSTRQAYETTRSLTISVIGSGTPINSVARLQVRELLEVLRFLPRNASKLFPNLSPREAADRARSIAGIERISASNANAYLGNFSSFMNWAVAEEYIDRNPARGLRFPDDVAKRDKRHPFSERQLKLIFHSPLYTGCIDGERGYATAGTARPQNARYWVPLIGLHTGMRLNEICQLDVTDIRLVDEVACICITPSSQVGSNDKSLKTSGSERLIPLHHTLLDLGLPAYAEAKRRQGKTKLFEEIDAGSRGVRAVAFSKWFTQFLQSAGARKSRTSFHSFRHNFRDELRIARIEHDVAMALGGWVGGPSQSSAASESYGRGHRVEVLREAIGSLRFADIDLSHLRR